MKKQLSFILALLLPAAASAYDACINGIYYNIVKKARQATVTYGESTNGTYSGNVDIPATVEYDGVTCNVIAIGESAFNYCEGLTSVVIPGGVTSIGDNAFSLCTKLSSVNLPDNLKTIGSSAFNKTAIKSLSIPTKLTEIGSYAFNDVNLESLYISDLAAWCNINFVNGGNPISCTQHLYVNGMGVTDLVIPSGVTKVSKSAFAYATMLKSVSIPASVTEIGVAAFSGAAIEQINIPDSVETISEQMFYSCSNLKSITIGKGVKTIEYAAFRDCKNLENVYISDLAAWCRVRSTFYWNNGLGMDGTDYNSPLLYAKHLYLNGREIKDLVLPEKIFDETMSGNSYNDYRIGDVFSGFEGLTSIVIPKEFVSESILGRTYIALNTCKNLKSFKNNAALKSINVSSCESLTYLDLGTGVNEGKIYGCEKLVKIDSDAETLWASKCDELTTICLGMNTESVRVDGCKELTDVYCAAAAVPEAIFGEECQVGYATLHVLENVIEKYRAADGLYNNNGWKDFGTIVALKPGDPGYFKPDTTPINFADATVKALCVENWDFDGNGELSVFEASQVKDLGNVFREKSITSFDELKYFTAIKSVNFNNCSSLTSVIIPSGATSLNFSGCSKLSSINIPDGVTSINFNNCSSLTSVVIPNSVTIFNFSGCSKLASVNIPVIATSIPSNTFYGCTSLSAVHITDLSAWCGITFENNYSNPLYYAHHLYLNGKEVTDLVIPDGVKIINNYTFYGCNGLVSVIIPNSVTTIGYSAFNGCEGLTSVTIPEGVISIGEWAFHGCTGLTSVTIPKSLTSIGTCAFAGLTKNFSLYGNLTAVHITDLEAWCRINFGNGGDGEANPLYYAHHLYLNGKEVTDLVIPSSIASVGRCTFVGCEGLNSVTIPNTVKAVESLAFDNCTGLKAIHITDLKAWCEIEFKEYYANPLRYANHLYLNGKEITELVIPTGVNAIKDYSFQGCSGLLSVSIPSSVTSIGNYTFYGCSGLTSITIPGNVTSIGNKAFYGCSGLIEIKSMIEQPFGINDDVFQYEKKYYNKSDILFTTATLYVPKGTKAKYQATDGWKNFTTIIEIGDMPSDAIAFNDAMVKSICLINWDANGDGYLSKSEAAAVTDLGEVFKDNENIRSFDELQYFTGLTSIRDYAFSYCSGLTSVTIPSSVTSIGKGAFYGSGLTSVIIPNSVTTIGKNAFVSCSSLTSITIPSSVTDIGSDAFAYCSDLASISIESGNPVYDSRNNCNAIISTKYNWLQVGCKGTVIPNSVTSIGSYAFYGSGLTSITIPNSVTYIADCAFFGCSSLAYITVESGNTVYDSRNNCNAIIETSSNTLKVGSKNTVIPNSVTNIGGSAFSGNGLTSIRIPRSVTTIGYGAFEYCHSLISVTVPNSVTSIGRSAFSGCDALTSFTIPNSVSEIGDHAFWNCSGLKEVRSRIEEPFAVNIFTNFRSTLYVPRGTKAKYQATEGWKNFETIIETDFKNEPQGDVNGDNVVDVADIASVIDVMAKGTGDASADVNGDGVVDVADIATIIDVMAANARQVQLSEGEES